MVTSNPWEYLKAATPARIALGRAGHALPTRELLAFQLAHARARDAVHLPLDVGALQAELPNAIALHSEAPDRAAYLRRPDLGRRLDPRSAEAIAAMRAPVAWIICDGLSAVAIHRHAAPLLRELSRPEPLLLVEQGRVAIGDAIGELLQAELSVVLIGERPGLSSPDSLGIYVTYQPRAGRTDADRNCISNVRPEGLTYQEAARKLLWLIGAARSRRLSGVGLKEDSARALPDAG
ncbi:MAG: ethanolamine ammonia-lyase subunit EutC [Bryobacteraceae bacterium]|nr:ethanolamine ammonia-lyase subunit EutC [Bryobacteraceae bacterium]